MQRVEQMPAAESGGDRQRKALGKARERGARGLRPAAAADAARSAAPPPTASSAAGSCRSSPARFRPARTPARRHRDALGQHVLGQRDHHRAGPAVGRRCRRRARRSPGCAPDRRSRSPIWPSCRTPRGSRAPGTPRARACRARPGRRTRSSASNSWRAMWMPGEALVAPGPRVTKQMPGRPVALPTASAIDGGAALVPADRERDVAVVESVERGEIAFARHAEDVAHAVDRQLVDQDFAAGARVVLCRACATSYLSRSSPSGIGGAKRRRHHSADGANSPGHRMFATALAFSAR